MVEITKIEKIIEKEKLMDFVLITFKTDLGITATTRYPIQDVNDEVKMKQFVYEKAKFIDAKESFTEVTTKIPIAEADFKPAEPIETDEQKFQNAVIGLEQKKKYFDLGLVTKEQYDIELGKVKLLMPK